jgi:hypothetical protein
MQTSNGDWGGKGKRGMNRAGGYLHPGNKKSG